MVCTHFHYLEIRDHFECRWEAEQNHAGIQKFKVYVRYDRLAQHGYSSMWGDETDNFIIDVYFAIWRFHECCKVGFGNFETQIRWLIKDCWIAPQPRLEKYRSTRRTKPLETISSSIVSMIPVGLKRKIIQVGTKTTVIQLCKSSVTFQHMPYFWRVWEKKRKDLNL